MESMQPHSEGVTRKSEQEKARLTKLTNHDDIEAHSGFTICSPD